MSAPWIQTSFAKGEIAPSLWGHVDLAAFHTACATLRNMYVGYRGGAYSRAGTRFVGRSKQRPDLGQAAARLIPFRFSLAQQYVLELGDNYARFISNAGFVTESAKMVTGATQANPCQLTAPAHGFGNGDWVALSGLGGMTQLNGNSYIVAGAAANTFTLQDLDGNPVDSTVYAAYSSGGTASRIYTITTPYAAVDLPLLKWTQSADVMSLVHPNYPPYELARLGPTNWSLAPANFGATIAAPASATAVRSDQANPLANPNPTKATAYAYEVTAVDPKTGQESVASPIANVLDSVNIAATAGSLTISWAAVPGSDHYNIYKAPPSYNTGPTSNTALPVPVGSLFGYIGSSYGNQFTDTNITADTAHAPPLHKDPFARGQVNSVAMVTGGTGYTNATATMGGAGSGFVGQCVILSGAVIAVIVVNPGKNFLAGDPITIAGDGTGATATPNIGPQSGTYPGVAAYFQQRRVYAASLNNPDTYWMSQPGSFLDFDSSLPVNDADAISGTPASEQVNGIQFMVSMPLGLITFTGAGAYQIGAVGNGIATPAAITPTNQVAAGQSEIGSSSTLPPTRIDWDILFFEPDNATLQDLAYQLFFNIYTAQDLSWPSSHLLAALGHQVREHAWTRKPNKLLWMARDDGILLSFTYHKQQEVAGWARHDTQGQVRSLCSVFELPVDALYLCAQRPVAAGGTRFFLERMDNRLWRGIEDAWCVDCAVATTLPTPNASLGATAASGNNVTFTSSPGAFISGHVGQTIRLGGGIATVTGYTSPTQLTGNWLTPCLELVPNDPALTPITQGPGAWSIAANVGSVSGLLHLAGKQVSGLADGVPVGPLLVSALGVVNLPFVASKIVLGLGFTAQLQSVYLDTGMPTVQGRRKAITGVTIRTEASAPLLTAAANQNDVSALSPSPLFASWAMPPARIEQPASLPASYTNPGGQNVQPLFTGDLHLLIPSEWKKPGQVAVQQSLPVPLTVLALIPEVLPGDTPETDLPPRRRADDSRRAAA